MSFVVTVERSPDETRVIAVGTYGQGSHGNGHAAEVVRAVRAVAGDEVRRIVVDLSKVHYDFGDSIGRVFLDHADDPRVEFLLSKGSGPGWKGLLSLLLPMWGAAGDALRGRIRFV